MFQVSKRKPVEDLLFILLTYILCLNTAHSGCWGVDLVSRKDWGAKLPGPIDWMMTPVRYVIFHHTDSPACYSKMSCKRSVKIIQGEHMQENNWSDIGYHFLIGGDGRVYEGRDWNQMGGHTKGHNRNSLGIAFIGEYRNQSPSDAMFRVAWNLLYCGVRKGYISPYSGIVGHRDAYCTSCPGDGVYNEIMTWPMFMAGKLPTYSC